MIRELYRWLNLLAYAAVVLVNYAANEIPIGGLTTGEVSAMFPVLLTPASYAFSIWIVIYVLLGAFAIVQASPRYKDHPIVKAADPWFLISCVLNIAWILLWHNLYITSSVFVMLGLWVTLFTLYSVFTLTKGEKKPSLIIRLCVLLPFSVYLSWISTAALVNISTGLKAAKLPGFELIEPYWTVLAMLLAFSIALYLLLRNRDAAYSLTSVWALIAIGVEQQATAYIAWIAWALAALLLAFVIELQLRTSRTIGAR